MCERHNSDVTLGWTRREYFDPPTFELQELKVFITLLATYEVLTHNGETVHADITTHIVCIFVDNSICC
jgi:hypothetical protein